MLNTYPCTLRIIELMNTNSNTEALRETFGKHLRELRRKQRLSQTELALIIGVNHSTISRIENGRENVSLDTIVLLASGLSITPSQLLEGTVIPSQSTLHGRLHAR